LADSPVELTPRLTGFTQYLETFLDATSLSELWGKLRPELSARFCTLRGQPRHLPNLPSHNQARLSR
jgi:hypothetical protein